MVTYFRIQRRESFRNGDRNFYLILPLLPWSEVAGNLKNLVRIKFLVARLEMNFVDVFLWDFDWISNLCFREILHLNLFCCIDSSESRSKENLTLVFKLNVRFSTGSHKINLRICPRHIIQMNIYCRVVSLVFRRSKLNSNNCEAFRLNETNFRVKFEDFVHIMPHSKVNRRIRLID